MKSDKFCYDAFSEFDKETGWEVVRLAYSHTELSRWNKSVGIIPKAGANMFSLTLGEEELLWQAPSIKAVQTSEYGNPVLYPTPNRVRSSQFTFNGVTYKFKPNWKEHFLHGLVHGTEWRFEPPRASSNGASLLTYIDFEPGHKLFDWWPFRHKISLLFNLDEIGVRVTFSVENYDQKPIPFGFAMHPFFNILGSRSQTFIAVPAQKHMQAEGLLPTGLLEDPAGHTLDIRRLTPLLQLDLDDVYWGMTPENPARYEVRDKGIRVTCQASAEFTHMVVYTPRQRFFCLENQTCSTDAHNLHHKGLAQQAHLLIVQPGKKVDMWIKYIMEWMD